jgi:TRAP-type uncharacterized transport system fused permease subunit
MANRIWNNLKSKQGLLGRSFKSWVLAIVVVLLQSSVMPYISRFYGYILSSIDTYQTKLTIFGVVVALGFGAYRFKKFSQFWYGTIEIIFGGLYAFNTIAEMHNRDGLFAKWAVLVGCVYILARGFSNVKDSGAAWWPLIPSEEQTGDNSLAKAIREATMKAKQF